MKDITFNYDEKTIIISKAFEKKAKLFGTEEYKALVAAKADFPDFKIQVNARTVKRKVNECKIDYDFMLKYIEKSERKDKEEIKKNFYALRCMDKDGKKIEITTAKAKTFFEVKHWFLEEFKEEIKADQELIDSVYKKVA